MKKFLLLVLSTIFTGCYTTKSTISSTANLDKYTYVTLSDVMNYRGAPELMDIEVKIYDALASTRLHVIGDKQTTSLSPDQKQQLLLVRFAASQNDSESAVSINFVDYATGVPVASCIGKYGLGLTKNNDMKVALDKAIQQIKYLFD